MLIIVFFNRGIKGICGLTKGTVVGLLAHLESRELRCLEYASGI
jgi:hypothetical protein